MPPAPRTVTALGTISAAELKGDLSFLASDVLQGRFTPSPGLEVAAEFIASKFRAAGLEPGGNEGYFQTTEMVERQFPKPQGVIGVQTDSKTLETRTDSYLILRTTKAASVTKASVAFFGSPDPEALKKADISGKAVVVLLPDFHKLPPDKAMAEYGRARAFDREVEASEAAVEITVRQAGPAPPSSQLISEQGAKHGAVPHLLVTGGELAVLAESANTGQHLKSASVEIPAPIDHTVKLKNVVGVLRGSDPVLKSTCVLLTAHYDHIGTLETGSAMSMPAKTATSDRIYNGANDDGSGTVSVIEIARTLAKVHPRPKRSLVFVTFFGEERGEFGSKFYGQHPTFPINKNIADINLEQVGRTDSTNGKQVNTASLTGYDYSDVPKYVERAGALTGIRVYKDPEASDAYFTRSDNDALAEQGVPAHSLTVAFDYPDYHGLGDEWTKIDYENMARVDRMVALSLLNLANSPNPPKWNAANPKAASFREAQKKLNQKN